MLFRVPFCITRENRKKRLENLLKTNKKMMTENCSNDSPSPTNCRYCYRLHCSVSLEPISSASCIVRKSTCKNAQLIVGRNEWRQILLKLDLPKSVTATYLLNDVRVHYRFAKEGRGAIEIPDKDLIVRLSNCPPQKLLVFLKSIETKLALLIIEKSKRNQENATFRQKTPQKILRERLLNGLPKIFVKLSPLTLNEIKQMRRANPSTRPLADRSNVPFNRTPPSRNYTINQNKKDKNLKGEIRTMEEEEKDLLSANAIELSSEQKRVLKLVVNYGKSVFFTGPAGTGKSLLLGHIVRLLPPDSTFVTAATGVAACQIGGVTLHSFAGLGASSETDDFDQCLDSMTSRKHIVKQWRQCCHLIIDEISMVGAEFFEKLEKIARHIRDNSLPFGGIQLIVCGDFFQLPPVHHWKTSSARRFCFETPIWNQCIMEMVILSEVRRQSDPVFVEALQKIRIGRCDPETSSLLTSTRGNILDQDGILATRLCTHTSDADLVNDSSLYKLTGESRDFSAKDSELLSCNKNAEALAPKQLCLKVNAQVMLTKNLDLSRNMCNGSRGVVKSFESGYPVVQFMSGHRQVIKPAKFTFRLMGNVNAFRTQLPLKLAWAISIHKSQGMTLDSVEMSLGRVFEDGQAYVALSRARSLKSLRILDFDPGCVRANQKVVQFYEQLDNNCSNSLPESPLIKRRRKVD